MPNTPLKIGVVGYGYWSPKLIRNIEALPEFTLVGICEKDLTRHEKIQEAHPGIRVYQHYRDLFSNPEVDAVVIATIPSSHYRIAKLALENGKHVLVEKPLTLSIKEGKELCTLAQKQSCMLMVDHTFLYTPAVHALRDTIREGKLGKIYALESIRTNLGLFQRDTNVLWDLAPHDFSILLFLIPEHPVSVLAVGSTTVVHPKQKKAQESDVHITLTYAKGMTAHVHVSWISPVKTRKLTVVGSERMALYDHLAEHQVVMFDQGVYPTDSDGESGPLFDYKIGETTVIPYETAGEDLARMLADFGRAVTTKSEPESNAELGLEVVRLLCAAQKSLDSGNKKVSVSYR